MLIRADLAYPTNTKIGAARSLVLMSGNASLDWGQVKANKDTRQRVQASSQWDEKISNNITTVFFFLLSDHNQVYYLP